MQGSLGHLREGARLFPPWPGYTKGKSWPSIVTIYIPTAAASLFPSPLTGIQTAGPHNFAYIVTPFAYRYRNIMHPCLEIPELLDAIVAFSAESKPPEAEDWDWALFKEDTSANVTPVRLPPFSLTCSYFHAVAVRCQWQSLPRLSHIRNFFPDGIAVSRSMLLFGPYSQYCRLGAGNRRRPTGIEPCSILNTSRPSVVPTAI